MVIKVADFGLSVNVGAKEYYRLTKHTDIKLPLMWMAPESLSDYMFSEMSDVVSKLSFVTESNICSNITMPKFLSHYMHAVELWSDVLGNIHWRPSSLYRR